MEVTLEKRYPLAVDTGRAWQILGDVPVVAGCMPGAELTEQIDATHYKGIVKVKVGPASANFAGEITVATLDASARTLQLIGKGADRGGSTASLDLTATVEAGADPSQAVLAGRATMIVNGKFAQFGGRMMVQVSDMLLAQFVENFRSAAGAISAPAPSQAPAAEGAVTSGAALVGNSQGTDSPPLAAVVTRPVRGNEINGLALAWGLVRSWFSGLLGKRA